jgi:hypothetical protein
MEAEFTRGSSFPKEIPDNFPNGNLKKNWFPVDSRGLETPFERGAL